MSADRAARRRGPVIALVAALAVSLAPAPPAQAHGPGGRPLVVNEVRVAVERDGKDRIRARFQETTTRARTLTARNEALAYASCTGCGATAVAFQVVLAGRAATVDADNTALAVNESCDQCETFAGAYQFVVAGGGDLRLSRAGSAAMRGLRHQVQALQRAGLGAAETQARADTLAGQVMQLLVDEVVVEAGQAAGRSASRPPVPVATAPPDGEVTAAASAPGVSVTVHRDVDLDPAG